MGEPPRRPDDDGRVSPLPRRPNSLRAMAAGHARALRDWLTWSVAAATSVGAAVWGVAQTLQGYVTEAELRRQVQAHSAAHRPLEGLRRELEAQRERLERLERRLQYVYWLKVGEKAAGAAPRPRRAQAAREARERFAALVRHGISPEEAYRRALDVGLP